jgi:hypothetical protein
VKRAKVSVLLSFVIFLAIIGLLLTPITIQFKQLALVEDKTVIRAGSIEVTSNDIIAIFSIAAGSATLSAFITQLIIPESRKILKRR